MQRLTSLYRTWLRLAHSWLIVPLLVVTIFVGWVQWALAQLPTALAGDALATQLWLDRSGGGAWLQWLGLQRVAQQGWVRAVLALAALFLVQRLWSRWQLARSARQLQSPLHDLPFTKTLTAQTLALEPNQVDEQLAELAERHRLTTKETEDGVTWEWIGDRQGRRVFWQSLWEIGWLLLLLLVIWQLRAGWQSDALILTPGDTLTLAPYDQLTLQMTEDGSRIRLCCQPTTEMALPGSGMRKGGLQMTVSRLLPVLQVQARTAQGPLALQDVDASAAGQELLLQFPQERSERAIAIPERNVVLVVVALGEDRFQLQLRDAANAPLSNSELHGSGELVWQDVHIKLQASRAAELSVGYRPGLWLLWPALALLGVGLWALWRWPYVRWALRGNAAGGHLRWQGQWRGRPSSADILNQLQGEAIDT